MKYRQMKYRQMKYRQMKYRQINIIPIMYIIYAKRNWSRVIRMRLSTASTL